MFIVYEHNIFMNNALFLNIFLHIVQIFYKFIINEHGHTMNEKHLNGILDIDKHELLGEAINAFQRETGLKAEIGRIELLYGRTRVDATIRIKEPGGTIEYLAEIRIRLTDTVLGRIVQHFKETPGKWIVITQHVPRYLAKKMKELGIQFIDTAGNTYIDEPPLRVFMCGNRPENRMIGPKEEGLLGTGGVRILFALLCQPQLENAAYREIGAAAGAALGTVAGVMKDLAENGFLLELGVRGRRLMRKDELVKKWIGAYTERFRHRKLIGRFTAYRANFWEDLQLTGHEALWGGEIAANMLTHYLKPATITLYTHKPTDNLVLKLKLRKDKAGTVELREQFWRFTTREQVDNIVPPLLVYADLLATADTRNIETAGMVYDQYVKRYFE